MKPLVLVTGGTGKTGRRLVSRLRESGVACRIAARGTRPADPFDWTQPGTWARTLEGVTAAYLVAPALQQDVAPIMIDFLELALKRGGSALCAAECIAASCRRTRDGAGSPVA